MPSDTNSVAAYLGRAPALAEELVKSLASRRKIIAAAESCTAGMASDFIARVPGASNVFWGSFVSYTPDAKLKMLGVQAALLEEHGAVSRPVALAMAEGALKKSGAFWALSVTGFAGPDGGSEAVPVGTVWIGIAGRDGEPSGAVHSTAKMFLFSGNRNEVREAAAAAALQEILERADAKH